MLGGDQLVTQLKSHLSARDAPPTASAPAAPRAQTQNPDTPNASQSTKDAVPHNDKH
jgi:hypothetical protein